MAEVKDKIHYPYGLTLNQRKNIWRSNWETISKPRNVSYQIENVMGIFDNPQIDVFLDLIRDIL